MTEFFDLIGMHENIDNYTYHNKTKGVSSSCIVACDESEESYRDYISNNKKTTKKMDMGGYMHDCILSPDIFTRDYSLLEVDPDYSKKDNEKFIKEYHDENPGKFLLTQEQIDLCFKMKESFFSYPLLENLYKISKKEVSYFIDSGLDPDIEDDFIVRKKCRTDMIIPSDGIVLDLKFTEKFNEKNYIRYVIEGCNYDLKAAWYLDIVSNYYETEFDKFGLIIGDTSTLQFQDVLFLDKDAIERGRKLADRGFQKYKEYLMKGNEPKSKIDIQFRFITTSKWR